MTVRQTNGETGHTEFVLELPSDLRLIEAAVAYLVNRCRAFDFEGSRLTLNFRVGVTEALANAMIYGNGRDPGKRVRVAVALDPSRVTVEVRDEGEGFDPRRVPDPTLPEYRERSGGRGLFLLRKLMDEVRFNECGNAVLLVLNRAGEPAHPHASGT
jgi:serine/threonine-protein kinase RsbW